MKNVITNIILATLFVILSGCDQQEKMGNHYPAKSPFTAQEFDTKEMKVPSFELVSAQDGTFKSSSEYEGQVLLITFFASWCGSCREEINSLKQIQEKFREQGFSVISISPDQDDPLRLKKLAEKAKVNYPILVGDKEIPQKFGGISSVPVTFLVNRSGFVTKKYYSHLDSNVLIKDIERVLSATQPDENILK